MTRKNQTHLQVDQGTGGPVSLGKSAARAKPRTQIGPSERQRMNRAVQEGSPGTGRNRPRGTPQRKKKAKPRHHIKRQVGSLGTSGGV